MVYNSDYQGIYSPGVTPMPYTEDEKAKMLRDAQSDYPGNYSPGVNPLPYSADELQKRKLIAQQAQQYLMPQDQTVAADPYEQFVGNPPSNVSVSQIREEQPSIPNKNRESAATGEEGNRRIREELAKKAMQQSAPRQYSDYGLGAIRKESDSLSQDYLGKLNNQQAIADAMLPGQLKNIDNQAAIEKKKLQAQTEIMQQQAQMQTEQSIRQKQFADEMRVRQEEYKRRKEQADDVAKYAMMDPEDIAKYKSMLTDQDPAKRAIAQSALDKASEVDSGRFLGDSTHGVLAGISVAFGALADIFSKRGTGGHLKMAHDMIMKAIEDDVQQQRETFARKSKESDKVTSDFDRQMKIWGNEQEAADALMAQRMKAAASQMQVSALKIGNQQIMQDASVAANQLMQQADQQEAARDQNYYQTAQAAAHNSANIAAQQARLGMAGATGEQAKPQKMNRLQTRTATNAQAAQQATDTLEQMYTGMGLGGAGGIGSKIKSVFTDSELEDYQHSRLMLVEKLKALGHSDAESLVPTGTELRKGKAEHRFKIIKNMLSEHMRSATTALPAISENSSSGEGEGESVGETGG